MLDKRGRVTFCEGQFSLTEAKDSSRANVEQNIVWIAVYIDV
jgi:hypothetical protein